jgi:hypothetical protein
MLNALLSPLSLAQRFAFAKHGAGADVDSAWEQEKPEATRSEMLENRAESPVSSARFVRRGIDILYTTRLVNVEIHKLMTRKPYFILIMWLISHYLPQLLGC